MKGNFDQLFRALANRPASKKATKETRKKRAARINAKHPGHNKKPDHTTSSKYAFKGGNPKKLKALREAVEQGLLTLDEALLQLRPEPVGDTEIVVNDEPDLTLQERLIDIRLRKEEQRTERKNSVVTDGFVYMVVSPAYPGWVKVGQTSDYESRLSTYQTASPHADYCMVWIKYVDDRRSAESKILDFAKSAYEVKGEWIKTSVDDLLANFNIGV